MMAREDEPGPREALQEGFTDPKLHVLDLGFDSEIRASAGIAEDRNDGRASKSSANVRHGHLARRVQTR